MRGSGPLARSEPSLPRPARRAALGLAQGSTPTPCLPPAVSLGYLGGQQDGLEAVVPAWGRAPGVGQGLLRWPRSSSEGAE